MIYLDIAERMTHYQSYGFCVVKIRIKCYLKDNQTHLYK